MNVLPHVDEAQLPADAIEVGRILDAWGVKGWFKVAPHSVDPEALFSSRQWFVQSGTGQAPRRFDGTRKLRIKDTKEHSGGVTAAAHGVDTRDDAELLRGARVFVARSSFPTLQADEFYQVDLLGLQVVNREGGTLGMVVDLMSSTAQTVLVVQSPADAEGKTRELLIPFVAAWVDGVDVPQRQIRVDWQADY